MSEHAVVTVVDETGAAITPTAVKLVAGATTHAFADVPPQGLSLDLATPAAGTWQLVLELPDHPPLPFQVQVAGTGAKTIAFAGDSPRCCALASASVTDGSNGTRKLFTFAFSLSKKHTELVMLAGWDYHGGSDNTLYAKTWRDDLYSGETWQTGKKASITKRIGDATVVTIFDFKSGNRVRYIKGKRDWHVMDRVLQGSVPTHTAGGETAAAVQQRHDDDSISIVHAYRYVQDLGVAAAGSLLRFDIFSHAWVGGPIMIDTWQAPDFDAGGAREGERDPGDKDGRSKDFSSTNMTRRGDFKKAFAADAVAKMWGCQATTDNRALVRAAAGAKDPDATLSVSYAGKTYAVTAKQIAAAMNKNILPDTYMKQLAKTVGITMYGAPPGMGASLRAVGARNYMFVDQSVYKLEYAWYKSAIGLVPDETGYFPYAP